MSDWVSCRIKTSSHILVPDAFRVLQLPEASIRVSDIRLDSFRVAFGQFVDGEIPERTKVHHAINGSRAFLVALNVATIGLFYWQNDPWANPIYGLATQPDTEPVRNATLVVRPDTTFSEKKEITEIDVQNTAIVFGMLARQSNPFLENEYVKGILLLRTSFYDVNFNTEAFMCFWRALENFVGERILKVKKLKNELRDLQTGLTKLGATTDLVAALREVYVTRSSQVAHAQIAPKPLTFDEVMKAKVFLDFVMHKTFKAEGIELLESRR
jgi:hypothetical protein